MKFFFLQIGYPSGVCRMVLWMIFFSTVGIPLRGMQDGVVAEFFFLQIGYPSGVCRRVFVDDFFSTVRIPLRGMHPKVFNF
jgi:hypothetical protein